MSRRPASARPGVQAGVSTSAALSPRALLGFALADVTRLLRITYDTRLSADGLSGASWRVLAYLYRQDGLTQTQLAELLEVSRPAIGQMIDRLEGGGLVERRTEPKDRRAWCVFLSPHAHGRVEEFLAVSRAIETDCFEEFTEKELSTLSALVARLRDHLNKLQSAARDEREKS